MPLSLSALEINNLSSEGVLVYDLTENKTLYEKNTNKKDEIASLTKIMTALVAIEKAEDIDKEIIVTYSMLEGIYWDASTAGFQVGDKITYKDAIMGLLMPSGADAAQILSVSLAGSEKDYVKFMNEKAKSLGMTSTNYVNTTGLDTDNHYSSINDLLKLMKYALSNETFRELFTLNKYTTTNDLLFEPLINYYNKKLGYDLSYVLGSKTGYTEESGLCLITLSNINDEEVLTITLGATDNEGRNNHIKDLNKIYNEVKNTYTKEILYNKGDTLLTLNTRYASEKEVVIKAEENIYRFLDEEFDKEKLSLQYDGENVVYYNIPVGTLLGKINIYYNEELVKTIDVKVTSELHFSFINFVKENIVYIIIIIVLTLYGYLRIKKAIRRIKRRSAR